MQIKVLSRAKLSDSETGQRATGQRSQSGDRAANVSAVDESRESDVGGEAVGQASSRRFSPGRVGSSLRYRNYRLYFFGQLVSVMGTWMQTVAQSFLVLDLTHSGTDLGFVTAARFLPILLFGPAGGLFADRRNKRRILYVTQALSGVLAGVFALLTGTHVIQMWLVYVLALSLGFVNVFDNPARQSFISEMVPPGDLPNAVTLNSVSLNLARVFGGALVGTLAWEFQVTLPLMASKVFGGGAGSYGVMASVMGVGAVGGGLISAARGRPRARSLCLAAIGWGIAITAPPVAASLPLELAAL